MQIGLIGLGRMGMNMGRRWLRGGHSVVAFNRSPEKVKELSSEGARGAGSLKALAAALKPPRTVWLMLPAGAVTDSHLRELAGLLARGDRVIDGANTFYREDIRHAEALAAKGIRFLDAGVSGGIWGLKIGYCTMVGGDKKDFAAIEPLLKALAPKDGYLHCGPVGAGHFVKMVHNGIEYGMMQAIAEGFEILEASAFKPEPKKVARLWNQGSVVRSWLMELAEAAFAKDGRLEQMTGYVDDSGEGRWTVQQAVESGVAAPVITAALYQRFLSRQQDPFSMRVLAALRNQFGGHAVQKKGSKRNRPAAGAGRVEHSSGDPSAPIKGL